MKRYVAILIILALPAFMGCAALEMAKGLLPGAGSGLSVDAQIGDEDQSVALGGVKGAGNIKAEDQSTVHVETSQSSASVETAKEVNVYNEMKPWVLILLILGWLLPTPSQCWRYMTRLWRKKDGE